jgi:uncharacterized integral membrane protein (TIGR00698 family)
MNALARTLPWQGAKGLTPGVIACVVIAAAAKFLSEHYGAPVILFALLLGIAMNFLASEGTCTTGVSFSSRTLLRWGVALLGLRITAAEVTSLGWQPLAGVIVSVALTIGLSVAAARLLGFRHTFGLLSGGATAICGGSAAMALAVAMPPHPQRAKALSFTVIGVSTLSTLTMVIYPVIARYLGLDPTQTGIFLGGSIHDVAGVVGAGYSVSAHTGDIATVVKLVRVAMLVPVIALTVMLMRAPAQAEAQTKRPPLLPWFIVVFACLVVVNSLGWVPRAVASAGVSLSGWLFVISIAAIGIKTEVKELVRVGLKPVLLMIGETLLLAVIVIGLLRLYH